MYVSVKIFLAVTGSFIYLDLADRLFAMIPEEYRKVAEPTAGLITSSHFWLVVILTLLVIVQIFQEYFSGKYRNLYWEQLSDDEARFVRKFANADHLMKKACLRLLDTDLSGESADGMDSSFFTRQTVKKQEVTQ